MPLPVLSLMLVVFSLTTGEFVIAGILPDVASDLSVSIAAAGLLVTAYAVGMIVGGPTVTVMTARLPRKTLIVSLLAVSIVGNLGSTVAPNYVVLLGMRFLSGLIVATFFAVAIATTVSMAPPGKQASAVAKVALGMNLGIILGTPAGTFVGQNFGWRATFAAVAIATALATLLVLRFVPSQEATTTGSVLSELRVLGDRGVQLAIALTALGNVGVVMVFSYIAPLLTEVSKFAASSVPILLLVYGGGAVVGNFVGGWLSDRALMPSLIGMLAVLAGVLALFWAASGIQVAAVVLTFAVGVMAFAIIPGMQTRVLSTASTAPTLAVAVNASGFQLSAAFAGWLGGRVIDNGPGLPAIYLVGSLLTLVGLAIAVYSHQRDRRLALQTA
ncbi:MFS transporter [Microbispora rosea subsp. aerata]|nr:MFS transporter [Microbispora rosea]GGO00800.1 MFS transporter [Microbispora rosea subsp. aerata]GIH56469.1 MFS transporter [Microbispora rosea subsp. aerata]GLJ84364.1 MFS transporter [Microbispora rosea subsp. aerata]